MNLLKLLNAIIARLKAVTARVRSTSRNAEVPRALPEAGTASPQSLDVLLKHDLIQASIEPTHSPEDTEHLRKVPPDESTGTASTLLLGAIEPDRLDTIDGGDEQPPPHSALPSAADLSETDAEGIGAHPLSAAPTVTRQRRVFRTRRPRKPYSPTFDFSQYPDVSDAEVAEFLKCADLGTLETIVDLTVPRLDALLLRALSDVRLIGELPISETAFRQIAGIMRNTYLNHDRLHIRRIPPALFVTSMVFCARYSEEEARNFWTPYARLVWGLPEASPTFQSQCRKHFEACRKHLSQWFGFVFPTVEGQDGGVVHPVYHHAVIPYYLEDSFAKWLAQNLEDLHALSANYGLDALPSLLANEPSLNQVPRSLRSFVLDERTSAKASALITLLCEASELYLSGEEDVPNLISSPIERALWHKVQQELDNKVEKESRRRGPQPTLTWGWSLEDEELQLRLAHVSGSGRNLPALCVWTEPEETALSESDHYVALGEYLWRNRDGWLLDEVRLSGGPLDGQIAMLSDEHEDDRPDVLLQKEVPPLLSGAILFARESRRGWATFVGHECVTDGDWLISMAEGVALWSADGARIASCRDEYVPDLLREHSAHVTAGWYTLSLPVKVTQNDELLFTIEGMAERIGLPILKGPCLLPNLSSRIPPVFTGLPLTLCIPGMTNELLSHTTLSIGSTASFNSFRLDELRTRGVLSIPADGDCTIALDTLFPGEAGVYTLNLRCGLKSLLDEPLQFSYLPGVEIQAPELDRHYSPGHLPKANLFGVAIEQVVVDVTRAQCEPIDDAVRVTWHDLRTPECSLRVEINGQSIPLAWPINRTYAWVDPLADDGTLRARDRDATVIHIRGNRYQYITWRVGGASEREVRLNAKGELDFVLSDDAPLLDMIEERSETHVPVEIVADDAAGTLFTYVRTPDLSVQQVVYDAVMRQLILECQVGPVCRGDFQLQVRRADPLSDEPEVIADFERLEPRLVFGCDLTPGKYLVEILTDCEQYDVKALDVIPEPEEPEHAPEQAAITRRRKKLRLTRQRPPVMHWVQVESRRQRIDIPQFIWCPVPAGPFVMGGDPDAENAWPGQEFELPYQFWILKYPVTVAQFAIFVQHGGYQNYEYWQSLCWSKKGKPPKLENRGSLQDECPITKVSWCEAFAFANWLNNELPGVKPPDAPDSYVIRLPRECEWEKAARYPDGRLFPWGNDWDATRLHWQGNRAKRPRRVGSFPRGAQSELGIFDLLGNVSEWCLTVWRETYDSPQGESNIGKTDEERCIRGGSWATQDPSRLRSAARTKAAPGYRRDYIGFRLVVSKPIRWIW